MYPGRYGREAYTRYTPPYVHRLGYNPGIHHLMYTLSYNPGIHHLMYTSWYTLGVSHLMYTSWYTRVDESRKGGIYTSLYLRVYRAIPVVYRAIPSGVPGYTLGLRVLHLRYTLGLRVLHLRYTLGMREGHCCAGGVPVV